MNLIQSLKWFFVDQFMFYMGGGGGGGPTSTTTQTSNIPDWLRPQVEADIGATTQELFNTKGVAATPAKAATYDAEGNQ